MPSKANLLPAVAMVCLCLAGCGSPPASYQDVRSEDGRCVCQITEYDDPKGDAPDRLLDLQIDLDGSQVLGRSYLGRKLWDGKSVRFSAVQSGRYYYLSVVEQPEYAIAAIDGETRAVWFQSTDEGSAVIKRAFDAGPGMPKLTDLNWLNAKLLGPHAGG